MLLWDSLLPLDGVSQALLLCRSSQLSRVKLPLPPSKLLHFTNSFQTLSYIFSSLNFIPYIWRIFCCSFIKNLWIGMDTALLLYVLSPLSTMLNLIHFSLDFIALSFSLWFDAYPQSFICFSKWELKLYIVRWSINQPGVWHEEFSWVSLEYLSQYYPHLFTL